MASPLSSADDCQGIHVFTIETTEGGHVEANCSINLQGNLRYQIQRIIIKMNGIYLFQVTLAFLLAVASLATSARLKREV